MEILPSDFPWYDVRVVTHGQHVRSDRNEAMGTSGLETAIPKESQRTDERKGLDEQRSVEQKKVRERREHVYSVNGVGPEIEPILGFFDG